MLQETALKMFSSEKMESPLGLLICEFVSIATNRVHLVGCIRSLFSDKKGRLLHLPIFQEWIHLGTG
jgi:hypothetical protein